MRSTGFNSPVLPPGYLKLLCFHVFWCIAVLSGHAAPLSLSVEIPLGPGVFQLAGFEGREAVNQLFQYELKMIPITQINNPEQLVGQEITFSIGGGSGSPRYFHGICSRVSQGENTETMGYSPLYHATVVPSLWRLSVNRNLRIFANKSIVEIIQTLFGEKQVQGFQFGLYEAHAAHEYVVQYQESDFKFISRLMEEEGIYYYFVHSNGDNRMVFSDHPTSHPTLATQTLSFVPDPPSDPTVETVHELAHTWELIAGKVTLTDYNFETPSTSLLTSATSNIVLSNPSKLEIYDYPGGYATRFDGIIQTNRRLQAVESAYHQVDGSSTVRAMSAGYKFVLAGHPNAAFNGQYFITSVTHKASKNSLGTVTYNNTFTCIPAPIPFRPPRTTPKPIIEGPQSAIVVNPGAGSPRDQYARVKVRFPWDLNPRAGDSSVWIRVAQTHTSGAPAFIPEVDDEVLVSFEHGDPDRPVILGTLYNPSELPVFKNSLKPSSWSTYP